MNPLETRGTSRILLWVLLAAAIVLYGFPFVYLLLTSFKTPLDAIAVPPTALPETWTIDNYVAALSREGVPAALVNSVVTAVISTLLSLLLTSVRAQTTPVVIANFQSQFGLDWGGMTALAAVYSVPVILLTLFLQRHIVAGLTLGAVKG